MRALRIALIIICIGGGVYASTLQHSDLYGPGEVRGSFLLRGVGARAIGMGGAFSAVADDASAISWNPGGLGQLDNMQAVAMYDSIGFGACLSYLALSNPIGRDVVVGASLTVLSYGSFDVRDIEGRKNGSENPTDLAGAVSVSIPSVFWLTDSGGSGLSAEVVRDAAGDALLGFNSGLIYPLSRHFTVGLAAQHIGPSKDGYALPAMLTLGSAFALQGKLGILVDADVVHSIREKDTWLAVGTEMRLYSVVAARVGYRVARGQGIDGLTGFTAGGGVRIGKVGVDYAYQPFGDLTTSHRMSLSYGIPPPRSHRD